jgi:hypothetical protein
MSSSNRSHDLLDVLVRVLHVAKLTYAIGYPTCELGGHVRDDGVEVVERVLLLEEGRDEAFEQLVGDEVLVVHRLELVLELLELALALSFFLSFERDRGRRRRARRGRSPRSRRLRRPCRRRCRPGRRLLSREAVTRTRWSSRHLLLAEKILQRFGKIEFPPRRPRLWF